MRRLSSKSTSRAAIRTPTTRWQAAARRKPPTLNTSGVWALRTTAYCVHNDSSFFGRRRSQKHDLRALDNLRRANQIGVAQYSLEYKLLTDERYTCEGLQASFDVQHASIRQYAGQVVHRLSVTDLAASKVIRQKQAGQGCGEASLILPCYPRVSRTNCTYTSSCVAAMSKNS